MANSLCRPDNKLTRIDLLRDVPKDGICAELGVLKGDYSEQILFHCRPKLLYLVDIFTGQVPSADQDGNNFEVVDMGDRIWRLGKRFEDKPVEIVKSDAAQWLFSLRPGSLDFCYIDTSHEYEATQMELSGAQHAVRTGGIIAGHDYDWNCFPGVVSAVNEFCEMRHMEADIYRGDKFASFFIINH